MRRGRLTLVALLIALALAEVGLRLGYPIGKVTYRRHPEYLHTTIPNTRRLQPMPARVGGGRNLVELGPEGYRGPGLESPKRRPRLAVVGDSLVMAENVALEDSFPARLGAHLGDAFEVVGVGASGYGPDQALLRLEAEWDVLQPDRVLLVLCATNDHGDVVRNKLFRLDEAGSLRRGRTVLGPDVVRHFEQAHARSGSPALVRLWRAFRGARERDRALADEAEAGGADAMPLYLAAGEGEWEDHEGGDPTVRDLFRDYYDADIVLRPESPSAQGKRALMGALMERWGESLRERGTPLSILIVPSAVDLDPTFRIRVDAARYPGYEPRAQTRAFQEACARSGAPTRDLFDLFAESDPEALFVGFDDIHWNERGIDLAARDVAEWLSAGR